MRLMRIVGLIHYILVALAVLGVAAVVVAGFWLWNTKFPDTEEYENAGYAVGGGVIMLTVIGVCLGFLAPLSCLLGNRLLRRRWRVFCIVLAVCEFLWGLLPGVLVAIFLADGLTVVLPRNPIGVTTDVILSILPPGIPIVLAITTVVLLSLPSVRASFRSNSPGTTPSMP